MPDTEGNARKPRFRPPGRPCQGVQCVRNDRGCGACSSGRGEVVAIGAASGCVRRLPETRWSGSAMMAATEGTGSRRPVIRRREALVLVDGARQFGRFDSNRSPSGLIASPPADAATYDSRHRCSRQPIPTGVRGPQRCDLRRRCDGISMTAPSVTRRDSRCAVFARKRRNDRVAP